MLYAEFQFNQRMVIGYNLSRCRGLKCRDRGRPYKQILMENEDQIPRPSQTPRSPHTHQLSQMSQGAVQSVPKERDFRPIDIVTNHYEVKLPRNMDRLVVYRVKIIPAIPADDYFKEMSIINCLKDELNTFYNSPAISGNKLYTTKEHNFNNRMIGSNRCGYTIQLQYVTTLKHPTRQFLIEILKNDINERLARRKYQELKKTGEYIKFQMCSDWKFLCNGFKIEFVEKQHDLFLRVNSVKKLIRSETALQFIKYFYSFHNGKPREEIRALLSAELKNKTVKFNSACCIIVDVQFFAEGMMLDEDKQILNATVQQPGQVMLAVEGRLRKDNKERLISAQLCLIENFNEQRKMEMSEPYIKNPPENVNCLLNNLKFEGQLDGLHRLGIRINPSPHFLEGKKFEKPVIMLGGNNKIVFSGDQTYFCPCFCPIFECKNQINCMILHFEDTDIERFEDYFNLVAKRLSSTINIRSNYISGNQVNDILNDTLHYLQQNVNICLVVLPNNMKNDYKRIQYNALIDGMLTQFVIDDTLMKKDWKTITENLVLQVIAKRGNTLWWPKTLREVPGAMLLAFAVSKAKEKTLLAVTSTLNPTFSSIYTDCIVVSHPEEKFEAMVELSILSLQVYLDRNKNLPSEVILFLNSCTGDQASMYHDRYFARLMRRIKDVYNKAVPVTAVMVYVQNSQRFFVQKGLLRNVPAGTLIRGAKLTEHQDFFIVSQQSNDNFQSMPSRYRVIYCDSKLEEEALQELIFGQCFNYVNWTGSIEVPAILQYAKKCAKFSADVLESGEVPKEMRGNLYYL